jgi:hypothetical protein
MERNGSQKLSKFSDLILSQFSENPNRAVVK